MTLGVFLMLRARLAYLRTFNVSAKLTSAGLTHASINVRLFPPSESWSMRVSFESRYGTCPVVLPPRPPPRVLCLLSSPRAEITLPSASSPWLIRTASSNRCPVVLVRLFRSDPAKFEQREICMHLHSLTVEKVHLFQGCSEAFIRELVTKLKPQICIPHEYVINRGDQAKMMYFIARGTVEVLTDVGGDKLGELHEGDYFGEMAVLQQTLRTCSVRTKAFCDLYYVECDELHELLNAFDKDKKLILRNAVNFFTELEDGL